MRRTKEDAEQTRKAILNSAMDMFYEKGYSKTTFDEIARQLNGIATRSFSVASDY